jgi:hypothetical protein
LVILHYFAVLMDGLFKLTYFYLKLQAIFAGFTPNLLGLLSEQLVLDYCEILLADPLGLVQL